MTVIAQFGSLALGVASADGSGQYNSPNQWTYVVVGWVLIILMVALYAALTLWKGRRLARQLPAQERRWTS